MVHAVVSMYACACLEPRLNVPESEMSIADPFRLDRLVARGRETEAIHTYILKAVTEVTDPRLNLMEETADQRCM